MLVEKHISAPNTRYVFICPIGLGLFRHLAVWTRDDKVTGVDPVWEAMKSPEKHIPYTEVETFVYTDTTVRRWLNTYYMWYRDFCNELVKAEVQVEDMQEFVSSNVIEFEKDNKLVKQTMVFTEWARPSRFWQTWAIDNEEKNVVEKGGLAPDWAVMLFELVRFKNDLDKKLAIPAQPKLN